MEPRSNRTRISRWDKIVFLLGVFIKCYQGQGLSSLTILWIDELEKECLKYPVMDTLYHKICLLTCEEISILELHTSYRNMLKYCTEGLREEIRSAIDTIDLTGV
jgi:hypothetical protein